MLPILRTPTFELALGGKVTWRDVPLQWHSAMDIMGIGPSVTRENLRFGNDHQIYPEQKSVIATVGTVGCRRSARNNISDQPLAEIDTRRRRAFGPGRCAGSHFVFRNAFHAHGAGHSPSSTWNR